MQLPISIDPTLPTTLQEQLFRELQRLILRGIAGPGMVLPGSRQLAAELGVSRNTAVLAVERLASEGYVSPIRGRGMSVSSGLPESFLSARGAVAPSPPPRRASGTDGGGAPGARPLAIDFRIGSPSKSHFPVRAWRRAIDRQLQHRLDGFFEYPDPAGLRALRVCIAARLAATRGVVADTDDVVIVSGLPEALDIAASVLSLRGRLALVEKPCYAR